MSLPASVIAASEPAAFFRSLGERVCSQWRQESYDEHCFPRIATEALCARPPAEHVRYRDLIDALLFHAVLPPQPREQSFGQPSIVVYAHARFFIEVLCWMDATTTIHQHAFSGAFHVLEGSSVHTTFAFDLRERINGSLLLGDLRLQASELLEAGDTRTILAGSQLIHGLFHLAAPSISVVVRTRSEPDAKPQYDYLPPFVALDPLATDATDQQRSQLLAMLLATDIAAFRAIMNRLIDEADLATVFQLLRFAHQRCVSAPFDLDATAVERFRQRARLRFGARIEPLFATVVAAARISDIQLRRAEITDPDHRFFLALLINLPDRREVLRLVRARYGAEPEALILRWLGELTRLNGDTLCLLDVELSAQEGEHETLRALLQTVLAAMLRGAGGAELREQVAHQLPGCAPLAVPELELALRTGALHALFATDGAR